MAPAGGHLPPWGSTAPKQFGCVAHFLELAFFLLELFFQSGDFFFLFADLFQDDLDRGLLDPGLSFCRRTAFGRRLPLLLGFTGFFSSSRSSRWLRRRLTDS